ncbi:hypothetical protein HSBAA_13090 [Vreelandella sulfidaeris]|uniref:Siderophore-interacting FAD-binding domain-containing protein n=1 Tax=Vreelandella sulfidaeris TaxID=115553 RepID=A0A455U486_9GAMM|nr:hypothetical protein HSBAA_13090 [Halomonas sulfidaeris]
MITISTTIDTFTNGDSYHGCQATLPAFDITLARRTQVSASLVKFTFTGPDVGRMETYAPDQRIKLFFPESGGSLDPLFEIAKLEEHDWYGAYQALPDAQRPLRVPTPSAPFVRRKPR